MRPESNQRIGVIGSGLGGLSAACVLAARGYRVTVFEKNPWIGGKAAVLRQSGYRFDMGPTILIYPSVLRRIFAEAGRDLGAYLQLLPLEPQWRCFFKGGSTIDLHGDPTRMREQLCDCSPETAASYERLGHISEELHTISKRFFFWRSIGSVRDTFQAGSLRNLSLLRDISRMKPHQTIRGAIRGSVKDERIAQMLEHMTQYVGSSPEKAPAILCAIEHMQRSEGVWYPLGGTRAIPEALERLGRELGVEFRTNVSVRRIVTEENRVTCIETQSGELFPLAAVVANSDAVRTYQELLGGPFARTFNRRRKVRTCLLGDCAVSRCQPEIPTAFASQFRLFGKLPRGIPCCLRSASVSARPDLLCVRACSHRSRSRASR